jgi:hypothetical protein
MVFLTWTLSSGEPTEGKIIGGWGEIAAKIKFDILFQGDENYVIKFKSVPHFGHLPFLS